MNAMLLAAGLGTRLRAVEPQVPKALVDVGGEPLLARQLRYLGRQGVSRVVVNAHHMAGQVLEFAREHRRSPGLPDLVVVEEPVLLGTAGGVRNALDHLGGEAFLVLYGDVVVDEPLAALVERHRAARAAATIAVYRADETQGKGVVEVDAAGLVRAFVEKGERRAGPALINAGIYVTEPGFVAALPAGCAADFGHDLFPAALARGERLAAHVLDRPVVDVGTPEALRVLRAGLRPGDPG